MPSQTLIRVGAVLGLATCCLIGTYGTHVNGSQNGFFETLSKIKGTSAKDLYIPGAPKPYTYDYTGVSVIDSQLRILVGFFAGFLHGDSTWPITVATRYLTLQFCAGWALLSLEGLRNGNKGKALSWTGTMGFLFQNAAYTVIVPLYLILHLLTSPTSRTAPSSTTISVDPIAARILPLCVLLGFGLPTAMMILPTPSVLSAPAHYAWVALWQLFPVWQSVALAVLRPVFASIIGRSATTTTATGSLASRQQRRAVESVYRFVMAFAVVSHLAVLAVALVPDTALPEGVVAALPGWVVEMLRETDLASVFVPVSLANPPAVQPASVKVIPTDWLAPLAFHFLQYDIYSGNAAVLIWTGFLYYVSASLSAKSSLGVFAKAVFWFVFGGPVAMSAYLLWERDDAVYQGELRKGKKVL